MFFNTLIGSLTKHKIILDLSKKQKMSYKSYSWYSVLLFSTNNNPSRRCSSRYLRYLGFPLPHNFNHDIRNPDPKLFKTWKPWLDLAWLHRFRYRRRWLQAKLFILHPSFSGIPWRFSKFAHVRRVPCPNSLNRLPVDSSWQVQLFLVRNDGIWYISVDNHTFCHSQI